MSKAKELLESAERGTVGDFDEHFRGTGKRSEYAIYKDEAEEMDVGDSIYIGEGVKESTVSSIRNQVYKLNPEDEKIYKVEMSKKRDAQITEEGPNGETKTYDAYNVRILHKPEEGE